LVRGIREIRGKKTATDFTKRSLQGYCVLPDILVENGFIRSDVVIVLRPLKSIRWPSGPVRKSSEFEDERILGEEKG
jgi:hypothetical protein